MAHLFATCSEPLKGQLFGEALAGHPLYTEQCAVESDVCMPTCVLRAQSSPWPRIDTQSMLLLRLYHVVTLVSCCYAFLQV